MYLVTLPKSNEQYVTSYIFKVTTPTLITPMADWCDGQTLQEPYHKCDFYASESTVYIEIKPLTRFIYLINLSLTDKLGLMEIKYRSLILREQLVKFLLTKLNTKLAFLHALLAWWLKDSFESIDTQVFCTLDCSKLLSMNGVVSWYQGLFES